MIMHDLSKSKRSKIVKLIHNSMWDWCGFDLTSEQIAELVDEDMGYWLTDILVCGMDTVAREGLADRLAIRCAGRAWPTGAEDEDSKTKFWKDLAQGAKRLGYKAASNAEWNLPEGDPQTDGGSPSEASLSGQSRKIC